MTAGASPVRVDRPPAPDLGRLTIGCMSLGLDSGGEWNSGRFVPDRETGIAWVRRAIVELGWSGISQKLPR